MSEEGFTDIHGNKLNNDELRKRPFYIYTTDPVMDCVAIDVNEKDTPCGEFGSEMPDTVELTKLHYQYLRYTVRNQRTKCDHGKPIKMYEYEFVGETK